MSRVIADLRELTHQVEQISDEIAKKYDLEHLAGPRDTFWFFYPSIKIKKFL